MDDTEKLNLVYLKSNIKGPILILFPTVPWCSHSNGDDTAWGGDYQMVLYLLPSCLMAI